ncbi:MAG: methyltransferase domain-containing protein [Chloroflexota bacterium]|nr:MAG: methyltransferase domain-containing protein [Chloroflexota bacterium]
MVTAGTGAPADLKSCCANLYQSDWARLLLGDSFHPGGLALTERLGQLLRLSPDDRVLDVAAGRGTSAIHLAKTFGCRIVGVDFGAENVAAASDAAATAGVADRVTFRQGDAEWLSFDDKAFDAAICECAFCTFPEKKAAAAELARVLRPGGRVGLSDLVRQGELPRELEGLLAWAACIADARPVDDYVAFLVGAGFIWPRIDRHDSSLVAMVVDIRRKLLGAQILAGVGKLNMAGVDWANALVVARAAADAVSRGKLGYATIVAEKPIAIT